MPISDLIFSNLRRKIFALTVAILVWLVIHFARERAQKAAPLPPPPATNSLVTP